MKISRTIWIAIGVLLLWLALSWRLGAWLHLHAPAIYYLRGGLAIIGIIGFVGFLLLKPKSAGGPRTVSAGEVEDNFSEATRRLQSTGIKQMASLSTVFFLGDSDTAKTTVIAKSDIAQLLAGQAQQDVSIVPTRAVNFWIAKNTVLVDPAGALLADAVSRKRLFKKFSAVAFRSVLGSQQLPARSVVFTVDCGALLQKGGADAMAVKARQFQTILAEMAEEVGSRFPVYVLFTKADKISYFRDFVENLTEQEAADVLGVTLPMDAQQGVYAQQQTSRLNDAFQQLFYSLADKRATYLSREHKPAALPNIYEFPREFNKLKALATSFLVDLCRPSQLGISPFLRGFYFTGIRPVTVSDVAPATMQVPADDSGMESGATRMFNFRERGAPLPAEARDIGARKVAQWVFLPQFLPNVILADAVANTASSSNVKLNVARRFLLGAATAAALIAATWWIVSYGNNKGLIDGALNAAKGAPSTPSLDALQRLNTVKNTLETLNSFEENGRPLSYAAFLYSGDDARESVRKTYYGLFRRLLLAPTQERLVQVCTSPNEALGREYSYTALKAYLMTTQFHEKSTPEFLAPALLQHWRKDQPIEEERQRLAQQNFDFYARELTKHNEYLPQTEPDGTAVQRCRDYLNGFGQRDRIYQEMLADAAQGGKPIVFNVDYPGTEATVVNRYRVDPAFSKGGFGAFEAALKNPEKYFNGDSWVLGEKSKEGLDTAKLVPELRQRYDGDFLKAWQAYLQATAVRRPAGIPDAVGKLEQLGGSRSALLLDLCVASENTAVADKDLAGAFQPVQSVTPPGCLQSAPGGNASQYLSKLVALQQSLKAIEKGKEDTYKSAQSVARDAETEVKDLALGFKGPTDEVVKNIMLAPIYSPGVPPNDKPNALASNMCEEISPILEKYPFNPTAREDATLDELNKFLKKPDGILWKVAGDAEMKPYVNQLNDKFYAASDQTHSAKPAFIGFLNKAAALGRVLYGGDGQTPTFNFTMKSVPSDIVDRVLLKINGQTLSGTNTAKQFTWPGNKEGVQLDVQWSGGSKFDFPERPGLWGLWHFMDLAKEVPGSAVEFKWVDEVGGVAVTVGGKSAEVHFTFDATSAQVLRPHYFKMTCVSRAI